MTIKYVFLTGLLALIVFGIALLVDRLIPLSHARKARGR